MTFTNFLTNLFSNDNPHRARGVSQGKRNRTLRIEELENREMLSVNPWGIDHNRRNEKGRRNVLDHDFRLECRHKIHDERASHQG